MEAKGLKASKPIKFHRSPSLSNGSNGENVEAKSSEKRKRKNYLGIGDTEKKRKRGRPKKFGNKGVTETLVSKTTKQYSVLTSMNDDGSQLSETDSDNKVKELSDGEIKVD